MGGNIQVCACGALTRSPACGMCTAVAILLHKPDKKKAKKRAPVKKKGKSAK